MHANNSGPNGCYTVIDFSILLSIISQFWVLSYLRLQRVDFAARALGCMLPQSCKMQRTFNFNPCILKRSGQSQVVRCKV